MALLRVQVTESRIICLEPFEMLKGSVCSVWDLHHLECCVALTSHLMLVVCGQLC